MSSEAEVRPFRVGFPETELTELRRRVNATRWPERETVTDDTQGVRLAMMQELARYWGTDYDWHKCEEKLNDLPHFITEIDGLDTHFIHVRSPHQDALPLIVTHGWPGSIIEQLKIIEPLTNPTAHGASVEDAFHLVIPSLPGSPWRRRREAWRGCSCGTACPARRSAPGSSSAAYGRKGRVDAALDQGGPWVADDGRAGVGDPAVLRLSSPWPRRRAVVGASLNEASDLAVRGGGRYTVSTRQAAPTQA